MGLYATTTSISVLLPGFLKGNTTTADAEGVKIFDKHFGRAESEINAVISSRYNIAGFTSGSVPPLLTKLAEDIATYDTIRGTGYRVDDKNEYLDDYRKAYDTLDRLIEGKVNLTYTDGSSVVILSSSRFISSTEGYTPIAGLDSERKWKRDKDEVDDQSDARS